MSLEFMRSALKTQIWEFVNISMLLKALRLAELNKDLSVSKEEKKTKD